MSKDALIEAAWPGQVVEDSNLPVQIAALRRALGEAPGGDRWIETMPRRGYRFVGSALASGEDIVTGAPDRVDAPRDAALMRIAEPNVAKSLFCPANWSPCTRSPRAWNLKVSFGRES